MHRDAAAPGGLQEQLNVGTWWTDTHQSFLERIPHKSNQILLNRNQMDAYPSSGMGGFSLNCLKLNQLDR